MAKGDRANLERLLRGAWEEQCRIQAKALQSLPEMETRPKEPRVRVIFNIAAAVAGVFGLGITVVGKSPIFGVFLMAASFVYICWEIFTSPAVKGVLSLPFRVLSLIIIGVVVCWVSWPHLRDLVSKKDPQLNGTVQVYAPPEPIIAIFAKCDPITLPIEIPPHDAIRVVPVNKRGMISNKWGSYEIPNNAKKVMQWPDKAKMDLSKRLKDAGSSFGYKCEVSNHGNTNLFDVGMTIVFSFDEKGADQNPVKFTPIISPLDMGHSSVIYFVNDCPNAAFATLPESATLLVVGEKTRRNTKLNLPNRNPIEPIMMWAPTKVKLVGWTLCD